MLNRSTLTMFHAHSVPRSCTSVTFIEEAVDRAVDACDSPKSIMLLALASIAFTGLGVWALTKLGQYMEEDIDQEQAPENRISSTNKM